MNPPPNEFDSPWKEGLRLYLPSILSLTAPAVYEQIDWSRPYESLDTELQKVARDAADGVLRADKLFRVWLKNGEAKMLYIHVEVQSDADRAMPKRAYEYNSGFVRLLGEPVVTLAILADDDPKWRPSSYGWDIMGCRLYFQFLMSKLLDLVEEQERLKEAGVPAALLVLANWAAHRTKRDLEERYRWKWQLTRRLYEEGYEKQDVLQLYRLLDWMLALPEGLTEKFQEQLYQYEKAQTMPYITSTELLSRKQGQAEGRAEGRAEGQAEGRAEGQAEAIREAILEVLALRFGDVPYSVRERLAEEKGVEQLRSLHRFAVTCSSLGEFVQTLG